MKRHFVFLIVVLPLLSLSSALYVYAQGGDPNLGGTKPTPTPISKDSKGAGTSTLPFGVEKKGKLDPKTSDKSPTGSFFEEFPIRADSEDLLSFRLVSNDPSLGLQILGRNNSEVAVAKAPSGDFKLATPTGGVPANGDYRVRVTGALNNKSAVPFTIKVDRLGLTALAYSERFSKIYSAYNEKDPASVEETIVKLEKLAKDAPNHSTAFERLGIIYLEIRKDTVKAEWAMDRAIKANGVARIKITYDGKWRPMTKLRTGELGFEDKRPGWLRIKSGILTLHDAADKTLVTLTTPQIKELSKKVIATYNLVEIISNNSRKPYIFAPETIRQVDADLVIKLIYNHIVGKTI